MSATLDGLAVANLLDGAPRPSSAAGERGGWQRASPSGCGLQEQHGLVLRSTPEVLEADRGPMALDLAAAGIADPMALRWLEPPPAGTFSEACSLLGQLGALDGAGRLTPHGQAMSRRSMHPRLSHIVLKGKDLGAGTEACEVAAVLAERDVLRRDEGVPEADIGTRLDLLRGTLERAGPNGTDHRRPAY